MKTKLILLSLLVALGAHAQTSAFTYQGRLTENGAPANGSNDFTFTLYASGGATVGTSNVVNDLAITNGLFTVTLDFGAVFDGSARWLEIAVRPGASAGAYTNLVPRQPITATPYAMRALNAGNAATATLASGVATNTIGAAALQNGSVDSAKIADGSIGVADLSVAVLSNTFWKLGGNVGATNFLGTTDYQPLEFKVNNQRGLRLEPTSFTDAVNVIGGSARNFVGLGTVGATIGGGGAGNYFGFGYTNRVEADFGTVSGGSANTIKTNADYATIGGGSENTISQRAAFATIGGGYVNIIQAVAQYSRSTVSTRSSRKPT